MLADSSATPIVKSKRQNAPHLSFNWFLLAGKESDKSINMNEEKKQREQILALNQVLAQQVIAKSRASQGKLSSSLSDISI